MKTVNLLHRLEILLKSQKQRNQVFRQTPVTCAVISLSTVTKLLCARVAIAVLPLEVTRSHNTQTYKWFCPICVPVSYLLKTDKIVNSALQFEVKGLKSQLANFLLKHQHAQNSRLLGTDTKILVCQLEKTYTEKGIRDLEGSIYKGKSMLTNPMGTCQPSLKN